MNRIALQCVLLAGTVLCLGSRSEAQGVSLSTDQIVQRMEATRIADRERQQAYVLRRHYQLYSQEEPEKRGEVIARVEYAPPDQKRYRIEQSSGGMIERVVHRILERETDPEQTALGEISRENYRFESIAQETCGDSHCFVLKIEPFKDRKDTLYGNVWVDARTFRIRRVAGYSAKSPSIMIRKVDVQLDYGWVEGMWMQRVTRAVADVRFKGKYEMLSREIGCEVAQARVPSATRAARSSSNIERRTAAASGIFLQPR